MARAPPRPQKVHYEGGVLQLRFCQLLRGKARSRLEVTSDSLTRIRFLVTVRESKFRNLTVRVQFIRGRWPEFWGTPLSCSDLLSDVWAPDRAP